MPALNSPQELIDGLGDLPVKVKVLNPGESLTM